MSKAITVLVIGGSIGGLSAAHALLRAGCRVTVLERAPSVSGNSLGAVRLFAFIIDDIKTRDDASHLKWPVVSLCFMSTCHEFITQTFCIHLSKTSKLLQTQLQHAKLLQSDLAFLCMHVHSVQVCTCSSRCSQTHCMMSQGLGLDEPICDLLRSWTSKVQFDKNSLPLPIEVNRVIEDRKPRTLFHDNAYKHRRSVPKTKDDLTRYCTLSCIFPWQMLMHVFMHKPVKEVALHIVPGFAVGATTAGCVIDECTSRLTSCSPCSTHWSNIHHTLLHALPDEYIVHFHHTVTDFTQPEGSNKVQVTAEVGEDKQVKTFEGDLLVAADGSMSQVRAKFRPQDKRRCVVCCCSKSCTTVLQYCSLCLCLSTLCQLQLLLLLLLALLGH